MRLRLDNPAALPDLVDTLRAYIDVIVERDGDELAVSVLGSIRQTQLVLELEPRLRPWRLRHPDVHLEIDAGDDLGILAPGAPSLAAPAANGGAAAARCVACGEGRNEDGADWGSYLVRDPTHDDTPSAETYCPDCAMRHFDYRGAERP